jgi:hypothetical protein
MGQNSSNTEFTECTDVSYYDTKSPRAGCPVSGKKVFCNAHAATTKFDIVDVGNGKFKVFTQLFEFLIGQAHGPTMLIP